VVVGSCLPSIIADFGSFSATFASTTTPTLPRPRFVSLKDIFFVEIRNAKAALRCEFCPRPPRAEEINDDDDFGESGAKGDRASREERDEIVDIIFRNVIEKKRDVLVVFYVYGVFVSLKKRVVFFKTDKNPKLLSSLKFWNPLRSAFQKRRRQSRRRKRKKEERDVEWSPSSFTARATKERWFFYHRVND